MSSDIRSRLVQFTTQPVVVDVPEFGAVHIRRMTLGELDRMQADAKAPAVNGERPLPGTIRLLARFLGDDAGQPVFDLTKPEDRDALLALPISIASDILRAGNRINRLEEPKADEKN